MKIESFDVQTNSQHAGTSIAFSSSRFTTNAAEAKLFAPKEEPKAPAGDEAVKLDIQDALDQAAQKTEDIARKAADNISSKIYSPSKASRSAIKDPFDLKISLLEQMIYALTGKRFRFHAVQMGSGSQQNQQNYTIPSGAYAQNPSAARETYVVSENFLHESESVSYTAQGRINTADGRTIDIDINMSMRREYTSYVSTSVRQQSQICDPLVINYGGTAASLSSETFSFDLDFDGKMDQVHFAGEGSGFLALDKNGDGTINDGSELFGPNSGNGFGELRAHDEDGNGWIDENDAVFSQLAVWTKDANGNDQLFKLKDLDIGAIYLGDTKTEFSFKDTDNNTQGIMRSTSFFLKESGGAGTVSHIDLAL